MIKNSTTTIYSLEDAQEHFTLGVRQKALSGLSDPTVKNFYRRPLAPRSDLITFLRYCLDQGIVIVPQLHKLSPVKKESKWPVFASAELAVDWLELGQATQDPHTLGLVNLGTSCTLIDYDTPENASRIWKCSSPFLGEVTVSGGLHLIATGSQKFSDHTCFLGGRVEYKDKFTFYGRELHLSPLSETSEDFISLFKSHDAPLGPIREGFRFNYLKALASHLDSLEALLLLNEIQCEPPLEITEVEAAWKMGQVNRKDHKSARTTQHYESALVGVFSNAEEQEELPSEFLDEVARHLIEESRPLDHTLARSISLKGQLVLRDSRVYYYVGRYWKPIGRDEVLEQILSAAATFEKHLKFLYERALKFGGSVDVVRKNLVRWSRMLYQVKFREEVEKQLLATLPRAVIRGEGKTTQKEVLYREFETCEFDRFYGLAVNNGLLDFTRLGKGVLPFDQKYWVTRSVDMNYVEPSKRSNEAWMVFKYVMASYGRKDPQNFRKIMMAYKSVLTHNIVDPAEQLPLILHMSGPAGSGKTMLSLSLTKFAGGGECVLSTNLEQLGSRFEYGNLDKTNLILIPEVGGTKMNSSAVTSIKALTGGGAFRVEAKHGAVHVIESCNKPIVMDSNFKSSLPLDDPGIMRRGAFVRLEAPKVNLSGLSYLRTNDDYNSFIVDAVFAEGLLDNPDGIYGLTVSCLEEQDQSLALFVLEELGFVSFPGREEYTYTQDLVAHYQRYLEKVGEIDSSFDSSETINGQTTLEPNKFSKALSKLLANTFHKKFDKKNVGPKNNRKRGFMGLVKLDKNGQPLKFSSGAIPQENSVSRFRLGPEVIPDLPEFAISILSDVPDMSVVQKSLQEIVAKEAKSRNLDVKAMMVQRVTRQNVVSIAGNHEDLEESLSEESTAKSHYVTPWDSFTETLIEIPLETAESKERPQEIQEAKIREVKSPAKARTVEEVKVPVEQTLGNEIEKFVGNKKYALTRVQTMWKYKEMSKEQRLEFLLSLPRPARKGQFKLNRKEAEAWYDLVAKEIPMNLTKVQFNDLLTKAQKILQEVPGSLPPYKGYFEPYEGTELFKQNRGALCELAGVISKTLDPIWEAYGVTGWANAFLKSALDADDVTEINNATVARTLTGVFPTAYVHKERDSMSSTGYGRFLMYPTKTLSQAETEIKEEGISWINKGLSKTGFKLVTWDFAKCHLVLASILLPPGNAVKKFLDEGGNWEILVQQANHKLLDKKKLKVAVYMCLQGGSIKNMPYKVMNSDELDLGLANDIAFALSRVKILKELTRWRASLTDGYGSDRSRPNQWPKYSMESRLPFGSVIKPHQRTSRVLVALENLELCIFVRGLVSLEVGVPVAYEHDGLTCLVNLDHYAERLPALYNYFGAETRRILNTEHATFEEKDMKESYELLPKETLADFMSKRYHPENELPMEFWESRSEKRRGPKPKQK